MVRSLWDGRPRARHREYAVQVFEIGSVSKQFTAAAVLLLAERHQLSLDDDIRKYSRVAGVSMAHHCSAPAESYERSARLGRDRGNRRMAARHTRVQTRGCA